MSLCEIVRFNFNGRRHSLLLVNLLNCRMTTKINTLGCQAADDKSTCGESYRHGSHVFLCNPSWTLNLHPPLLQMRRVFFIFCTFFTTPFLSEWLCGGGLVNDDERKKNDWCYLSQPMPDAQQFSDLTGTALLT